MYTDIIVTTKSRTECTWTAIPSSLLRSYAKEAVRLHGKTEQMENGQYFATAEGFRGAWAMGDTSQAALRELETVIADWAALKAYDGDGDIPVIGKIDLNGFPHL